ncbi:MFS transporter [Mycolicibacterium boenickei]|uniref:Chloramphenicol resistance protein n=1 Tax=Mycolicibacterium boenickei TaxID=146017 RepID=A0AAX3A026_9MYCO|nr:Cmx/CmrA family chloramphenicol efflux MFS transporter [Mycolicibacterium boenickei]PEG59046.1 MFS transporter [Mycolicibacterium boenickei]UNC00890.1 MFS transporter [Mycolicibacterium boenickei]BBX90694.1 chloramphenicol resistance protein [Mycolicibacterium boenickei]
MPLALYLLALAVFAMGTSEFMLAGLVPDIAADLGVTVGAAGGLTSAFAIGMVVGAPSMAALARRWPPRAGLLGCVVAFALCHVVGAMTPNFIVLFVTRVIAALANAGFLAVALSTAATLVASDRKGRALAILLGGTTAATIAGVPGGAMLGAVLGWRATFWTVALLCVPAALGILRGISAPSEVDPGRVPDSPSLREELAQLRSPALGSAMLLAALVNAGTFATFTFLAPIVTDSAGLGELWVPGVLVLFGFGSFLGVTIAGRFSDDRPRLIVAVGGPLLLVGWIALAALATHPAAVLILVFCQGVSAFAVGSTLIARVLYAASSAPTMGGSYATAALNIGATCGPLLAAASLAGPAGTLGPVWMSVALTGAAMLAAVLMAVRQRTLLAR